MRQLLKTIIQHNQRVFWILFGIDIVIVGLHILFGRHFAFFHLDLENNLPTAYQAFKLLSFGLLFCWTLLQLRVTRTMKTFVGPLMVVLLFLGVDEWFQVHENIYRLFSYIPWLHPSKIVPASTQLGYRSSLWILYYLPLIFIFVLWSGYWLRVFQTLFRSNFWIIALSIASLFVVLVAELLSSTGIYTETVYFWLVTLEEAAEMLLVSTLVLVGLKALNKGSAKH